MNHSRIKFLFFVLACCIEVMGFTYKDGDADRKLALSDIEPADGGVKEDNNKKVFKGMKDVKGLFVIDQDIVVDEIDLDGIGSQNDSIRLTSYKNQNSTSYSYVMLKVTLNQNEVIQKRFTGWHKKGIMITHGNLFSKETEGFVIRLRYYGSNYLASDIYAYEIAVHNGKAELIERLVLKDSEGESDFRKNPDSCLYEFKDDFVIEGEAYFIEELNRYGIKVVFYIFQVETPVCIIYWENDNWKIWKVLTDAE